MGQATQPTLEARALHLWRGESHVLKGLSVAAYAGECLHVAGANGCGKTSLLRTLAGFLWPDSGSILWRGTVISEDRDSYTRQLAYLGHDNGLKADLTVVENLSYATGMRTDVNPRAIVSALERVHLHALADRPVRTLSAGQRRRVAFARVLLADAPIWLLDEPLANLDASSSNELAGLVGTHVTRGGLVILTAHSELALPTTILRQLVLS